MDVREVKRKTVRDVIGRSIAVRGEDVSITPAGGEARKVRGMFTKLKDFESVGENDALRNRTTVIVSAEDGEGVSIGDAVSVRGKEHRVRDIEGNADYALGLVLQDA